MAAKLIVWAEDREAATKRMLRALDEYKIDATTLDPVPHRPARQRAVGQRRDLQGPHRGQDLAQAVRRSRRHPSPSRAKSRSRRSPRATLVEVSGKRYDVKVEGEAGGFGGGGAAPAAQEGPQAWRACRLAATVPSSETLTSPLQGTVFKVTTEVGAEVAEGDVLFIIEAMKMENEITAHRSRQGRIARRRRRRLGFGRRHARDHQVAARDGHAQAEGWHRQASAGERLA